MEGAASSTIANTYSATKLGQLSTGLAAPLELVVDAPVFWGEDADPANEAWRRLKVAARRPGKHFSVDAAAVLRASLRDPSLTLAARSQSLGLLCPAAIGHFLDPVLLKAEKALAATIAHLTAPDGSRAWRLPKLYAGARWQPVLVARSESAGPHILRVLTEVADRVPSWFGPELTWSTLFPERTSGLRFWPDAPFDCSAQTASFASGAWNLDSVHDASSTDRSRWNRSVEISAGGQWLAYLMALRRRAPSEKPRKEMSDLAFERVADVVVRLTGWDWAVLSHGGRIRQIGRRYEYVPEVWRDEAAAFEREARPTPPLKTSVLHRNTESKAAAANALYDVRGAAGGRRVFALWGKGPAPPGERSPDLVEALVRPLADEFTMHQGQLLAGDLSAVMLSSSTSRKATDALGNAVAAAFAADSIAIWRRLSVDGPFIPFVDYRRSDLAAWRSVDNPRGRTIPDGALPASITSVPLHDHPMGPQWKDPLELQDAKLSGFVSVFPILAEDHLFGLVEIIDTDSGRTEEWPSILREFFALLANTLPHLGELEFRDLEVRRSLRHMIRPALNSLEATTNQIAKAAAEKRTDANRRDLHLKVGQTQKILSDLRDLVGGLTEHRIEPAGREEDPVIDFARRSLATVPTDATDLAAQISGAFSGVQSLLSERGLSVSIDTESVDVAVLVPAQILQIVLSNLASNAAKYATAGTTIRVSARRTDKGSLVVQIANFGDAMTDQERGLIFDKRFRSYAAATSKIPGEGLGLYHVKGVIRLLGGHVNYMMRQGPLGKTEHTVQLVLPQKVVAGSPIGGDGVG